VSAVWAKTYYNLVVLCDNPVFYEGILQSVKTTGDFDVSNAVMPYEQIMATASDFEYSRLDPFE
jgi:hypothetical protein